MRYELADHEWTAIKPMLPNKPRGVPRVNDRRVLNGILWILRSGAPWRDLPTAFGPYTTCYNRFVRWRRAGVWGRIIEALATAHDAAVQMIDTSSLGLPKADIERLHSAAMFHDIGKAKIPLAVLDKPGRLDPEERALIETHPMAGYRILKGTSGVSKEILDAVRHHHEYLDGSGYPDGLCADGISDIVRVLTIADIFAALIEHRHYKPSMPREEAYEILCGMKGKLEAPLLRAFKGVALSR